MTSARGSDKTSPARDAARAAGLEAALGSAGDRLVAEGVAAELVRDEFVELYEHAPLPALTLDAAYKIQRMNRALVDLLEVKREHCIGLDFAEFVREEDRARLAEHLSAAHLNAERCRVHLLPSSGVPVPVELWTNVLARTGLVQVCVVDRRTQRSSELDADRLLESERLARIENAAKDTFIAMLSHELRTPLTPALAVASHFRRGQFNEQVTRAFGLIERNLLAEARMIDDLLDMNRVLRGKMSVSCSPASVHDVAREALEALRPAALAKDLRVDCELLADRHHASVDPLRLRQVFANLVRNAIKYTPEHGRIWIKSWNQGDRLAVEVGDDGIGISAEEMQKLFAPFRQLGPREWGGLGLGLAISRSLLELQGGALTAHSPGKNLGSRFIVDLATTAALEPKRPGALAPTGPRDAHGVRVLLVEDDVDSAEIIAQVLLTSGCRVRTAASAHAARAVDLGEIDVIVSDLGLPDASGLELIRELQANGHRPAIALTGYGHESDVRAAVEAGFDAHLTKPIDVQTLIDLIALLTPRRAATS